MRTVAVAGEGFRAYDVHVGQGLLAHAGDLIAPLSPRRRCAIVTDETVGGLHGARLIAALERAGVASTVVAIPPGEASKSFSRLAEVCDALLALDLDRGDQIVAFGGGVVGDLAGFAAAIYKRGVDFIQIPTTLLAQVDSSVGGKTAIDTPRGKNLIGAFHQPRLVLCDLGVLDTLPDREMRAGYAEVVKYGLLGDAAFFERLERDGPALLARDAGTLEAAVAHCVAMKAAIVAEDARDHGRRNLLNLGHTFGHAIEAETDFSLLHGEAVALGCALAFRFSAREGLCDGADAARVAAHLAAAGLPTRLDGAAGAPFAADRLLKHMRQDKKAEGGSLVLILANRIGEAFIAKGVDPGAVRDFLITEGALT
ncbi:MAG: 3-dehydroquinate synthase [Caulobacteraceae bacterium]|nr:3-dehydroquinate synthase [Caulobacteraceae bacterium]